ncbi:MAG: hypothetical protein GVY07_08500 [Bacteroidetes bacterium]|nr:hypothetical protein [Bacteroidota bacterium]
MKYPIFVPSALLCALLIGIVMFPHQLSGQSISINTSDSNINSEVTPRMDTSDAEASITNKANTVDLMIHDNWLVIQFTDRYLENLQEEIHGKDEEESVVAEVIRSMVGSGVRTLLDRAISISMDDISDIHYRDGTLKIYDQEGALIFEDFEIDDVSIMQDFKARDARRFVALAEKRYL